MTQPQGSDKGQGQALLERIGQLRGYVEQSVRRGAPAHEVEQGVWEQVLKLVREALGLFFALQGTGDMGESVMLANGRTVRRLPARYARA